MHKKTKWPALASPSVESTGAVVSGKTPEALLTLVDRAERTLSEARTAAEILDAKEIASFVYDAAKRAARLNKAKGAHDELLAKVHRVQADALEIEARAKRRLADEYDAAQERGEIATRGGERSGKEHSPVPPTAANVGLSRKDIHEARLIRNAEMVDPGVVGRTLNAAIGAGEEPTRAKVRRAVVATARPKFAPPPEPPRGMDVIKKRVREAISTLAGLPRAAVMVDHFRGTDEGLLVEEKLADAVAWLSEFSELFGHNKPTQVEVRVVSPPASAAPSGSVEDDAIEIPKFLRIGHPENTWRRRPAASADPANCSERGAAQ